MVKRTMAVWAIAAALMAAAGAADAQVFYLYPGAPPVADTQPALGGDIGFGDNLFRMLGYGRFNVTQESDLGVEVLIDNIDRGPYNDSNWRFGAGVDFKYAIIPTQTDLPFDLSLNGGFGFETGSNFTNFDIPVGALISRGFEMQNGRLVTPYGGLYIVTRHVSFDLPPGTPYNLDDTKVDVELRFGGSVEIVSGTSIFASAFIGDNDMFHIGVNTRL